MIQYQWWQDNVHQDPERFRGWVGDFNSPDRKAAREIVMRLKPTSILDCGCGFAVEADYYNSNGVDYVGLDMTDYFVEEAKQRNVRVEKGSIEAIPFKDKSVDVVYARHILEHLESFQTAVKEMIRVAKKAVVVVFFLKPDLIEKLITDPNLQNQVYLNTYSKDKILAYLRAFSKRIESTSFSDDGLIMTINLKEISKPAKKSV